VLTRADKRARELEAAGIHAGDVVALSMGNVVEYVVLLLAASRIDAIAMPVDPANGDRTLLAAAARLPLRAVVRRPRGLESDPFAYPDGYGAVSRKRLSGSLLTLDVLHPPPALRQVALPRDTELLLEAQGSDGLVRDIARTGRQLQAIGSSTTTMLELHGGTRLVCAQPLTATRFFDLVILGWLASDAQLVMGDSPMLENVIPAHPSTDDVVVVDSIRVLLELARSMKAAGQTLPLRTILPQATVPAGSAKPLTNAFRHTPKQMLLFEELGVLAVRAMERGESFHAAPGCELEAGTPAGPVQASGVEVLARTSHAASTTPPTPPGLPGGIVEARPQFHHTGYLGKFGRRGLQDVIGRTDSLVNLEGRRACLDTIRSAMLTHRRITWAEPLLDHTADGDPIVRLRYRATGETALDDVEEHAVGMLPPFMVPRSFERLAD